MHSSRILFAGLLLAGTVAAAQAQQQGDETPPGANAVLMNPEGEEIGNVGFWELEQGVRLFAQAEGLPSGIHAFHIHENGQCEGPDFQSAGGHYNPTGNQHGWNNPEGPHAGDLPNVHVAEGGMLAVEYFTDAVSLEDGAEGTLFPEGGTAVVIHEGADDYETDPAGDAGARIACGVIERAGGG